jgi:tRNA threonylcarbamoyladenosine biosynthesis protein TsaB
MRILAVDTATPWETIAILEGDSIRAECLVKAETTHSTRLLTTVAHMLRDCALSPEDVDAYAVGLGPGSFTGLRIGVASIKGMAMARRMPAVGVPSLDAMARALPFTSIPICPLIDARRGEVFTAVYRSDSNGELIRTTPFLVMAPSGLRSLLGDETVVFMGDGLLAHGEGIQRAFGKLALFAPPETWHPRASVIGRMALDVLKSGKADAAAPLVPIYVRQSDAEIHWEQRRGASSATSPRGDGKI